MSKSMNLNLASGLGGMLKDGHKYFEGLEGAVLRNIEAAKAISTITSTSMGPNGMHKLIVNHLDKIFVTSDCATIVKELEVQHPAARMLVLACQMQETEFGDGTNFTLSFAGELLKLAGDLIRDGIHAAEIVLGYKRAYDKCQQILASSVVYEIPDLRNPEALAYVLKPVLATKLYGYESHLAALVAEACLTTMPVNKKPRITVDNIRVAKLQGGSVVDSIVIKGMVVQRDTEGTVKYVENAKVTVFGCGIEAAATEAKATVLIRNADELRNYNKSEEKKMEEIIRGIAESGTNVVVSHGSISEMALHFIERYGLMCIKVQSKWDLRRLCSTVGATACVRLGPATPDEMGSCSKVEVREVGGKKIIVFEQTLDEDTLVATILLRASTENVLNDLERAVDDGVNAIKAACVENKFVAGAGAIEIELSKQLKAFADTVAGVDQYAIRKFAEALEFVPRILAENSGADATEAISALYTAHETNPRIGFNIDKGLPVDAVEAGIVDLLPTKSNALRLSVDAALTVLRVDQIVMSKPAGGPKPRDMAAADED